MERSFENKYKKDEVMEEFQRSLNASMNAFFEKSGFDPSDKLR